MRMEDQMHQKLVLRAIAIPCVVLVLADCKAHGGAAMKDPQNAQSSTVFSADTKTSVVRYQVRDIDRSVAFYTEYLGFKVVQRPEPVAIVSRGDLHLLLNEPGSSDSRP